MHDGVDAAGDGEEREQREPDLVGIEHGPARGHRPPAKPLPHGRTVSGMEAFGIVLIVVSVVAVIAAAISFIGSGKIYRGLGRSGPFTLETEEPPRGPKPGSAAASAEAHEEMRQLLEAKSYRRVARGEAPLDVEAEMATLLRRANIAGRRAARGGPPARDRPQRAAVAARRGAARRGGRGGPAVARAWRADGIRLVAMAERVYELEELVNRPGTYFNPQTEVMVVVDDSSSLDSEIFNMEEFEGADWVLVSDDLPVDEPQRDELLETFQATYHGGDGRQVGEEAVEDGDDVDVEEDEDAPVVEEAE